MKRFTLFTVLAVLAAVLAVPYSVAGQINSNTQTVTVNYSLNESITLAVAGGPVVIASDGSSNVVTFNGNYALIPGNHTKGIRFALYPAGGLSAALTGPVNVAAGNIAASFNSTWSGSPCTFADPDNVAAGVADQCFAEGAAGTSQLLTQVQLNATATGSFTPWTVGFGWFPSAGGAPTRAGSYTGNFTALVYAP